MISWAESADASALSELYLEIRDSVQTVSFFNWYPEKVASELQIAKTLIFKVDDIIASFITFRESADTVEIMALGTKPSLRRQGYLEGLLVKLADFAAERGKDIWLEVHQNNHGAVKLYQKWGFVLIQNRKSYYPDGASALVMTRKSSSS